MSDEGNNIIELMSEIRLLCTQIATLLKTCDQIVGECGWNIADSNVTGGNSRSLNHPVYWVPEFFCRFYQNEKYAYILFYVAVILDNRNNDPSYIAKNKVDFEPIITGGYYDYGVGNTVDGWSLWRCRWHVFSDDPDYNGDIYSINPKERSDFNDDEKNFVQLRSLALPLIDIKDSNYLKTRVLEPILNDLSKKIKT